ncbi:hypothetical protein AV530_000372 [Patagioenas fasciata monilis]|uniref:Uncharacterized protein n=1 Tax=Patagioenas fasciata monilis TaxID=372326 RepID=A0A1V4J8K3_PATFA|nr:hypothetical protein AV530_000372 [Patagioenas fasciata monilis]
MGGKKEPPCGGASPERAEHPEKCQFVKFANIEEDTPSYHRSYDFFVSRFSEMCHSSHDDLDIRTNATPAATLLQSKLNQIFEITIRPPPSPSGTITAAYGQPQNHSIPVYEMKFPDLCVY